MTRPYTAIAALLAAGAAPLAAQENLYPRPSAYSGVEFRRYDFEDGASVDAIRQVAIPIAAVVPIGRRFSVDIGTYYASTFVYAGGSHESFNGLTDTQLRASYIFGNDVVVASVLLNLPTGDETTSIRKFNIASAASSNFLAFPVNSYGTGTSVTGGLAAAFAAGSWNLGAAVSVRVSSEYEPFTDAGSAGVRYQPGLETRLRIGADRLIGSSRLTLGFAFSTFGNDQFSGLSGGGGGTSESSPGNRFLVQAALLAPVGSGVVNVYAWNFYRAATSDLANRENIFTLGGSGSFRLGERLALEPLIEGRIWSPEDGNGFLVGGGTALRIDLTDRVTLLPGGRFDAGKIQGATGPKLTLTGWGATAFLRYTF